jgi:putative photosynthetic complex assembly protein 2
LLVGVAIVAITWNEPNQVGTGTYLVLWIMRTSAKLNLFLGVRTLSEEFLPAHLAYLESFFRRRAMNWFFPFAVTGASAYLYRLISQDMSSGLGASQAVGYALVGTMLALAILEHLLLVLPLDTTALWRWAIRKRPANPRAQGDHPATFSGATATVVSGEILDHNDQFFQVH